MLTGINHLAFITEQLRDAVQGAQLLQIRGRVRKVTGTIIEAMVPGAQVGELCLLRGPARGFELKAEVVGFVGWMVGTTHEWNPRLSSNVTYAENRIPRNVQLAPDELDNTTYLATNLIYSPVDRYEFGIEYLYGLRENVDGQSGVANRIQVAFIFYLP